MFANQMVQLRGVLFAKSQHFHRWSCPENQQGAILHGHATRKILAKCSGVVDQCIVITRVIRRSYVWVSDFKWGIGYYDRVAPKKTKS
jgi:hypothetical protein